MAPSAEAETLGAKHRHYNNLVKQAIADGFQPGKIVTEESDLDNLLKIDVASKQKDVDYILEVLKSEDMLYVSRAIKQSTWLIQDRQYAKIINPEYLHTQLFPQMTTKASHKLILQIRLILKDEDRIDEFYKYFVEKDVKNAQKWLPLCSLDLIEQELKKGVHELDNHLFKRLSERGFNIFKLALGSLQTYWKRDKIEQAFFLLNTHTEQFLDTVENLEGDQLPNFGPKATEIIMAKCSQRLEEKFDIYAYKIDLPTFVKNMKKEEIKDFLIKHMSNEKLSSWFTFDNVKRFVNQLPDEGKFEFVKQLFIEKPFKDPPSVVPYLRACVFKETTKNNVYRWYRFAPFEVAFPEIKKLIRTESSSGERNSMLSVILSCAKGKPEHIQALLQYYHDKHMNEPFKFKSVFIKNIVSQTNTHNYDEKTWSLLNSIFHSMEVYNESTENNVQPYIEAIIAYNVLHNEKVPEILEKKKYFTTMKYLQGKLKEEDKKKIFNYLYNNQMERIQNKLVPDNEKLFKESLQLIEDTMTLLRDWKRDLSEHPEILKNIRELIKIKQEKGWEISMSSLYDANKKWRKAMFEESLALSTTEKSLINAVKHDLNLLIRNKAVVESVRYNDKVALTRLLRKLRVYFPQFVNEDWAVDYLGRLNQTSGLKATTRAICTLLPQKPLLELLQKHVPTEAKINWTEDDELSLSLRKYLAKYMHLARPLISPNIVLSYARGDYLQFALPSLSALSDQISSERSRELISRLLESPVSVQKHGLTLAFKKLQSGEMKPLFADHWKRNKNASIRAALFKRTFELLTKQKDNDEAEKIWNLLSIFIDNLSNEEDKNIHLTMGNTKKIDLVPLCVRGKFLMKSYKYLTSLPPKADCANLVDNVKRHFKTVMESLDDDFITEVMQKHLEEFTTKVYYDDILPTYMLCVKDEVTQTRRYNKVFLPLMERCLPAFGKLSEKPDDEIYVTKRNMTELLQELRKALPGIVFCKKMVFPLKLFVDIAKKLEEKLSIKTSYVLLRTWKLTATLMNLLDSHKDILASIEVDTKNDRYYSPEDDSQWNPLYLKVTKDFGQACIKYLKEDVEKYFPSINILFGQALLEVGLFMHRMIYFEILKNIIDDCDNCPKCYVMVLKSFPSYWDDKFKDVVQEIRSKIESHPSVEVKMFYYMERGEHI